MDMNRVFFRRAEDCVHNWHIIDAKGKILGRLATEIAEILRGKNKPDFALHTDNGDYVVVINAKDIVLSGNKMEDKIYETVSGWVGGKKELTAKQIMKKDATKLIHLAVAGMVPKKNSVSHKCLTRLKVYAGAEHPHAGQLTKI